MIPHYYYFDAKRRHKETNLTIEAMGGEEECEIVSPLLLAQRSMLEMEMEYYREECDKFTKGVLCFVVFACIILVLYSKGYF